MLHFINVLCVWCFIIIPFHSSRLSMEAWVVYSLAIWRYATNCMPHPTLTSFLWSTPSTICQAQRLQWTTDIVAPMNVFSGSFSYTQTIQQWSYTTAFGGLSLALFLRWVWIRISAPNMLGFGREGCESKKVTTWNHEDIVHLQSSSFVGAKQNWVDRSTLPKEGGEVTFFSLPIFFPTCDWGKCATSCCKATSEKMQKPLPDLRS